MAAIALVPVRAKAKHAITERRLGHWKARRLTEREKFRKSNEKRAI